MHKTSWASTLPSDRLTPKPKSKPKPKQQKPSTQNNNLEQTKSKAVRDLENLISNLSSTPHTHRDPKGGCFCLAREHPLSPYTPSCPTCALPLCNLNPPYTLCPSPPCSQPLLTPIQTTSLISSLQSQLAQTLEQEEKERQRVIDDVKRAEGAFPSLAHSSSTGKESMQRSSMPQLRPAHETSHKILSLTSSKSSSSGKQKVKLISISHTPTPTSSRPNSGTSTPRHPHEGEEEDVIIRVPPPPTTVDYVKGVKVDKDRPWRNYLVDGVRYVPPLKERKQKANVGVSGSSSSL